MVAAPDGLDHVRVAPVLPVRERFAGRAQLKVTALLPVQQPAEDPGTIEAGQAHPVDRSLLADERGGAKVAHHPVIADRRIPGVAIRHLCRLRTWRGPRTSGGWLRTQTLSNTIAHIRK